MMNAFGHLKAIGSSEAAKPLLERGFVKPGDGVTGLDKTFIQAAAMRFWDREQHVRTLA